MSNWIEWASKALDDLDSGMASKINEIKQKQNSGIKDDEKKQLLVDQGGAEHWVDLSGCDVAPDGTFTVTVAETSLASKLGIAFDVQDSVAAAKIRTVPKSPPPSKGMITNKAAVEGKKELQDALSTTAETIPTKTARWPKNEDAAAVIGKDGQNDGGRTRNSGTGDVAGEEVRSNANTIDGAADVEDHKLSPAAAAASSSSSSSSSPNPTGENSSSKKRKSGQTSSLSSIGDSEVVRDGDDDGKDDASPVEGEAPAEEEEGQAAGKMPASFDDDSAKKSPPPGPSSPIVGSGQQRGADGNSSMISTAAAAATATAASSSSNEDGPRQTKATIGDNAAKVETAALEADSQNGRRDNDGKRGGGGGEGEKDKSELATTANTDDNGGDNTRDAEKGFSSENNAAAALAAAGGDRKLQGKEAKSETTTTTKTKSRQKKKEETAPPPSQEIHWGVACDMLGQNPIRGIRWTKKGQDYDLCQAAYDTLSKEEKARFIPIFKSELPSPEESSSRRASTFGGLTDTFKKVAGKGLELVKKRVEEGSSVISGAASEVAGTSKMMTSPSSSSSLKGSAAAAAADKDSQIRSLSSRLAAAEKKASILKQNAGHLEAELEEKQQENSSLRQVWNEARSSLKRTQKALRANEERYRHRLMERESASQRKAEAKEREYKESILSLRKEIDNMRRDHDKTVSLRERTAEAAEAGRLDLERRMASAISEAAGLRDSIAELQEKNEDMVRARDQTAQEHARTLQALRSEHERLQAALESERRHKGTTLSELKHREGFLEDNNLEIANALAEAQRQADEKTRLVERVKLEAQWAKADKKAAEEQLSSTKERLAIAETGLAKHKRESKERLGGLEKALANAKIENGQLATSLSSKAMEIRTLEAKLEQAVQKRRRSTKKTPKKKKKGGKTEGAHKDEQTEEKKEEGEEEEEEEEEGSSSLDDSSIASRIKTMAQHLMKKQTEVDRVTAHRNALALQLETEQRAVKSLEKKIRLMRANPDVEYYRDRAKAGEKNGDHSISIRNNGGGANNAMANAHPSVAKAMRFLDSFSSFISVMLRRNPAARLFFGLYVLMIHLWVLFVLLHFMGHENADHVEVGHSVLMPPGGPSGIVTPPGV